MVAVTAARSIVLSRYLSDRSCDLRYSPPLIKFPSVEPISFASFYPPLCGTGTFRPDHRCSPTDVSRCGSKEMLSITPPIDQPPWSLHIANSVSHSPHQKPDSFGIICPVNARVVRQWLTVCSFEPADVGRGLSSELVKPQCADCIS